MLSVSYTYADLTDRDSFLKIREKKFVEPLNSAKPGCFRILVGTKADLIESGYSRKVSFGESLSSRARGLTTFALDNTRRSKIICRGIERTLFRS